MATSNETPHPAHLLVPFFGPWDYMRRLTNQPDAHVVLTVIGLEIVRGVGLALLAYAFLHEPVWSTLVCGLNIGTYFGLGALSLTLLEEKTLKS